ncbi:MAG: hypothetical protein PHQ14_06180, partial [Chromatiales bacterium]|nr:hypothetical protein [Chromatiales bacterium]
MPRALHASGPTDVEYGFGAPTRPGGAHPELPRANDPGKSIRRRDDRAEIWIHKGFSEEARYRAVSPTEENALWIQGSSKGASPDGLSGMMPHPSVHRRRHAMSTPASIGTLLFLLLVSPFAAKAQSVPP